MRGVRFACLVVLVVACAASVWGQQAVVFYDDFESGDTSGWWAPARVGETGQVTCYDEGGAVIQCAGTGQDGDKRGGVAWPNPRFVVNGDGTVTDMLTGLVWLRNGNCFGRRTWVNALADANGLASGACGLTDGSVAGDWRLPSVNELQSLVIVRVGTFRPCRTLRERRSGAKATRSPGSSRTHYWSSSSSAHYPQLAWFVNLNHGYMDAGSKTDTHYVWPVRAGQ